MHKRIIGTILGFVAASLVIYLVELVCQRLYPAPPSLDLKDPQALKNFMATLPVGALAIVLLAYDLGSLTGGILSTLIAGRSSAVPALIVGALLTGANTLNLLALPHPTWFALVSTFCFIPLTWVGSRLVYRAQEPSPDAPQAMRAGA